MSSDGGGQDTEIPLGEPQREEWIGNTLVEKYEECVRLVQPVEGQLAPESVVVPNEDVEMVAALIDDYARTTIISSSEGVLE